MPGCTSDGAWEAGKGVRQDPMPFSCTWCRPLLPAVWPWLVLGKKRSIITRPDAQGRCADQLRCRLWPTCACLTHIPVPWLWWRSGHSGSSQLRQGPASQPPGVSSTSGHQPLSGMRSLGGPHPPAPSDVGLRAGRSRPQPGLLPLALSAPPQSPSPRMQCASENQALSGTCRQGRGRMGWDRACSGVHVGTGHGGPYSLELGGSALPQRTCKWAALAAPVGPVSVRRPCGRVPEPGPAHGHMTRLSQPGTPRQGPADPSAGQATSGPSPQGAAALRWPVPEMSPWGRPGSLPIPRDPACPPGFYPCPQPSPRYKGAGGLKLCRLEGTLAQSEPLDFIRCFPLLVPWFLCL